MRARQAPGTTRVALVDDGMRVGFSGADPARQAGRRRTGARRRRQEGPRARHVHRLARGGAAPRRRRPPRGRLELRRARPARLRPRLRGRGRRRRRRGSRALRVDARRRAPGGRDGRAVPAHPRRARLAARRGARLPHGAPTRTPATSSSRCPRSAPTSPSSTPGGPTRTGNVQLPWPPDHLADVDLLVARASRDTVVSVEEIVPAEVVAAEPERTKLFGFEVDLLVEAPGGARPGQLPPLYHDDGAWIGAHRDAIGAGLLAGYVACSDDRLVEPIARWTPNSSPPSATSAPARPSPRCWDGIRLLPRQARGGRCRAGRHHLRRRPRATPDAPRQGRRARAAGALARRARAPLRRAPVRPARATSSASRRPRARPARRPSTRSPSNDVATTDELWGRAFRFAGVRPGDTVLHGFGLSMFLAGVPVVRALERYGARPVPIGAEAGSERMLRMAELVRPARARVHAVLRPVPRRAGAEDPRPAGGRARDRDHLLRGRAGRGPARGAGEPPALVRREALRHARRRARRHVLLVRRGAVPGHARARTRTARSRRSSSTRRRRRPIALVEGAIGERVKTSLRWEAQPQLRASVGDVYQVHTDPCSCGVPGLRIRVLGRTDDLLIVKGVKIYPAAVKNVVQELRPLTTGIFRIVLDAPPPRVEPPLRDHGRARRGRRRGGRRDSSQRSSRRACTSG